MNKLPDSTWRPLADGVHMLGASYVVIYKGRRCSPEWSTPGPAEAYYQALVRGSREPEYAR
jgi:hypothetical protein